MIECRLTDENKVSVKGKVSVKSDTENIYVL